MRIRIQLFTLMRIRILFLNRVLWICNHWYAGPTGLHFEPQRLHCKLPRPSMALFWASKVTELLKAKAHLCFLLFNTLFIIWLILLNLGNLPQLSSLSRWLNRSQRKPGEFFSFIKYRIYRGVWLFSFCVFLNCPFCLNCVPAFCISMIFIVYGTR